MRGSDSDGVSYAEVFQRNVMASGVIPQISVIMGPCAGECEASDFAHSDASRIVLVPGL